MRETPEEKQGGDGWTVNSPSNEDYAVALGSKLTSAYSRTLHVI